MVKKQVNPNSLRNKVDRRILRQKMQTEDQPRVTFSMYRYVIIGDQETLRNQLFIEWSELGVLGRMYIAREGYNAQMSVPEKNFEMFKKNLQLRPEFFDKVRLNIAVEDDGKSFFKLTIKLRKKIVADGLADDTFDVTNVGTHLDAKEWNEKLRQKNTIVVDMRNHYESEVGHFKNAILPDADTFREELPMVEKMLEDKKDTQLLLYCTGGIRCEKASAYFKSKGFTDVYQLNGGVINYARQVKALGMKSDFIGKNFVFDERLGERITEDVLGKCHQCGESCDDHTNCKNDDCHLLFIQCKNCCLSFDNCCSEQCKDILHLPVEERKKMRLRNVQKPYKTKLRPRLKSCSLA